MKLGTEQMNTGQSGFRFSAVRPEKLGASEYTLATVVLDFSGSVYNFKHQLEQMLDNIVEACRHSPRANNLLLRVMLFSDSFGNNGVREVHGFKPLSDVDLNDYNLPMPGGGTPLFDATFDAVVATNAYGKTLADQDFLVNAIEVIVTDGGDTGSAVPPSKIASEVQSAVNAEYLESNLTILVALNAGYCQPYLDRFHQDAQLDHMIDVADAAPKQIAKLGNFISRSISSQSQSLGTGGPSQNISATI